MTNIGKVFYVSFCSTTPGGGETDSACQHSNQASRPAWAGLYCPSLETYFSQLRIFSASSDHLSPDTGGQRLVINVADTDERHHWGQGGGEHVARDCTGVHCVCGVKVDQGGVAGWGRGTAAYWHQMKEVTPERVNILSQVTVTPGLNIIIRD